MFVDLPQNLILMTAGAFLLGWILSSISSRLGAKHRASRQDPRDSRIRSLEAELRVAQKAAGKANEQVTQLESGLSDANEGIEKRDNVITHQQQKLDEKKIDLKDSVIMTRKLRAELTDRATENIKSEVKLRDIETELEVAQASTDMIATGVLDYSLAPDGENAEGEEGDNDDGGEISKTAG